VEDPRETERKLGKRSKSILPRRSDPKTTLKVEYRYPQEEERRRKAALGIPTGSSWLGIGSGGGWMAPKTQRTSMVNLSITGLCGSDTLGSLRAKIAKALPQQTTLYLGPLMGFGLPTSHVSLFNGDRELRDDEKTLVDCKLREQQ
jgi:hypothetical protein